MGQVTWITLDDSAFLYQRVLIRISKLCAARNMTKMQKEKENLHRTIIDWSLMAKAGLVQLRQILKILPEVIKLSGLPLAILSHPLSSYYVRSTVPQCPWRLVHRLFAKACPQAIYQKMFTGHIPSLPNSPLLMLL